MDQAAVGQPVRVAQPFQQAATRPDVGTPLKVAMGITIAAIVATTLATLYSQQFEEWMCTPVGESGLQALDIIALTEFTAFVGVTGAIFARACGGKGVNAEAYARELKVARDSVPEDQAQEHAEAAQGAHQQELAALREQHAQALADARDSVPEAVEQRHAEAIQEKVQELAALKAKHAEALAAARDSVPEGVEQQHAEAIQAKEQELAALKAAHAQALEEARVLMPEGVEQQHAQAIQAKDEELAALKAAHAQLKKDNAAALLKLDRGAQQVVQLREEIAKYQQQVLPLSQEEKMQAHQDLEKVVRELTQQIKKAETTLLQQAMSKPNQGKKRKAAQKALEKQVYPLLKQLGAAKAQQDSFGVQQSLRVQAGQMNQVRADAEATHAQLKEQEEANRTLRGELQSLRSELANAEQELDRLQRENLARSRDVHDAQAALMGEMVNR